MNSSTFIIGGLTAYVVTGAVLLITTKRKFITVTDYVLMFVLWPRFASRL